MDRKKKHENSYKNQKMKNIAMEARRKCLEIRERRDSKTESVFVFVGVSEVGLSWGEREREMMVAAHFIVYV